MYGSMHEALVATFLLAITKYLTRAPEGGCHFTQGLRIRSILKRMPWQQKK